MAFEMAKTIERSFLIFGREQIPRRRVRIYKKVKRLALLLSIKKSILWCKLMNYAHPIKNHKFGDGSEILTDL